MSQVPRKESQPDSVCPVGGGLHKGFSEKGYRGISAFRPSWVCRCRLSAGGAFRSIGGGFPPGKRQL